MTDMAWLLDSDPSIRWQVLRDLVDADGRLVAAERARIATEGWGAWLLSARDDDGQWAGGACFPAPGRCTAGPGQPWTSTLHSLELLRDFGLDPASAQAADMVALVRANCRWEEGNQPFFSGETEPCINGRTVGLGAYFGQDVGAVVEHLLNEQLADGGWNCWTQNGSVRSSFATTLCVLEGLVAHEMVAGSTDRKLAARVRAQEYLLERSLFRRLSTGGVADPAWLTFSFPTRWHYDVLRALEYFRTVGGAPDSRLAEAVAILRSKQQPNGTWLLENTHPGHVHFPLEEGDGQPSRWNTLRALRVLRWYDGATRQPRS